MSERDDYNFDGKHISIRPRPGESTQERLKRATRGPRRWRVVRWFVERFWKWRASNFWERLLGPVHPPKPAVRVFHRHEDWLFVAPHYFETGDVVATDGGECGIVVDAERFRVRVQPSLSVTPANIRGGYTWKPQLVKGPNDGKT